MKRESSLRTSLSKARFPLGEFVRATRSENKNPAMWLIKIGRRKNSPRTSRKRSYFFVCSREQIRLVENGLNARDSIGNRTRARFRYQNGKELRD